MTPHDRFPRRSRADALLVAALASGLTIEKAAERAGVSAATVTRRLRDERFRERIAESQREAVAAAMSLLGALSLSAVRVLGELLQANVAPSVRLRAAEAVLRAGSVLREEVVIEQRLQTLENAIGQREGRAA